MRSNTGLFRGGRLGDERRPYRGYIQVSRTTQRDVGHGLQRGAMQLTDESAFGQ